jgi:16S rRNA C1402 N4-methylase RsmH
MVNKALNILDTNGVLSVITFHSGEQKIVNKVIKNTKHKTVVQTIRPSVDELNINFRARSAKLNVIKKLL